ncbi:hypothetical protein DL762_000825 [Monosporascus cannonballus]|uniref:Uncharacterized protein n=1 Tax=Monosporascus cannonballus TaxID=155416 RepID=A0ABY0HIJ5_9PEZI|nr:hypothetical protein DL762_000825 [Monosporascus cannonballus]
MLEGDCLQAAFGDLDRGNDPLAVHFANPPAAQNHPSIILRCGRYAAASSGARTNVPACYHPPPVTITTWSPSTKNAAPICVLALGLSHMVGTFFSENASQKAQETASGASASPVASTSTSASTSDPALANPTVLLEALEDPQRWFRPSRGGPHDAGRLPSGSSGSERGVHGGKPPSYGDEDRHPSGRITQDCAARSLTVDAAELSPGGQRAAVGIGEYPANLQDDSDRSEED